MSSLRGRERNFPPNRGVKRSQPQRRENAEVGEEDKLGMGEAAADERRREERRGGRVADPRAADPVGELARRRAAGRWLGSSHACTSSRLQGPHPQDCCAIPEQGNI
jgi:hypothetical protein